MVNVGGNLVTICQKCGLINRYLIPLGMTFQLDDWVVCRLGRSWSRSFELVKSVVDVGKRKVEIERRPIGDRDVSCRLSMPDPRIS